MNAGMTHERGGEGGRLDWTSFGQQSFFVIPPFFWWRYATARRQREMLGRKNARAAATEVNREERPLYLGKETQQLGHQKICLRITHTQDVCSTLPRFSIYAYAGRFLEKD